MHDLNCTDNSFGFEIDFLPVGEGERSGDAICIRWGYHLGNPLRRRQCVCVIDGGYKENGDDIVTHLQHFYATSDVDHVFNTHPDTDHVGGLHTVIEKCDVKNLWIHQPWTHRGLQGYFNDNRTTNNGIRNSLKDGLSSAKSLVDEAREKGVYTYEPLKPQILINEYGVRVYLLGPTAEYYHQLLPDFRTTPTSSSDDGTHRLEPVNKIAPKMVPSRSCPLTNDGATSAENSSSMILAFVLPSSEIYLFTGDAGINALSQAVTIAEDEGLFLKERLKFFQIPHHGSIQNLGPTILDNLFGLPSLACQQPSAIAVASVSKEANYMHTSKHVANALRERNVSCYETKGCHIHYHFGNVPLRGWRSATPLPYFTQVEQVR